MASDVDEWGAVVASVDSDDEELRALTGLLGARKVGRALDALGVRLDRAEERAAEGERLTGDRLDRIASALEAATGQLAACADRLVSLEGRQVEAERDAAMAREGVRIRAGEAADALASLSDRLDRRDVDESQRREAAAVVDAGRYGELRDEVRAVAAAVAALAEAWPSWSAAVADAVRQRDEVDRRRWAHAGQELGQLLRVQGETAAVMRGEFVDVLAEHQEHGDAWHHEQAAAVADLRALVAGEFERAAGSAADMREALAVVSDGVRDVGAGVASAGAVVASELHAVRDEVLLDGAARQERQVEELREGLGQVLDRMDRTATGLAEAVGTLRGEVEGLGQRTGEHHLAQAQALAGLQAAHEGSETATRELHGQFVSVGQRHVDMVAGVVGELRAASEVQVSGLRAEVGGVPDAVTAAAELFEGAAGRREVEASRRFEGLTARVEQRLAAVADAAAGAERLRDEQIGRVVEQAGRVVTALGAWERQVGTLRDELGEVRRKGALYDRGEVYDRTGS